MWMVVECICVVVKFYWLLDDSGVIIGIVMLLSSFGGWGKMVDLEFLGFFKFVESICWSIKMI